MLDKWNTSSLNEKSIALLTSKVTAAFKESYFVQKQMSEKDKLLFTHEN